MSRRTLGVLACVAFALPLVAALNPASTPQSLKLLATAMAVIAAVSPIWGLCALAALLPVARLIPILAGAPFGGEETGELLLAPWLFGASLRSVVSRWPASGLGAPAAVLLALVAAWAGLDLFAEQQTTMWPADFLAALRHHWLNDYFADRATLVAVHNAMPWIEGLALAVLAARVLKAEPGGWRPVVHALLAGAVANAAFAWWRVIEVSSRHDFSIRELGHFLLTQRFSTLFPDMNAASSLYALYLVAAIWLGLKGSRQWRWGLLAAAVVLLAFWVTGSRTAFAAVILALAVGWLIARGVSARSAAIGAGVAALLLAAIVLWNPGRTAQSSSAAAMDVRWRMARIASQIIGEHPVFGVGLGKFRQYTRAYITPDFIALFPQTARGENAHNNFLQIWAELGGVGLVGFLWLVGAAGRAALAPAAETLENRTAGPALAGGALAFLLTCLGGHPLLMIEILWIFLLVMGVMTGLAGPPARLGRTAFWVAVAIVAVVIGSVPVRVYQFRRHADLDHVSIGAGHPTDANSDQVYRLAEARSRWFVSSAWRRIEIPLRVTPDSQPPCLVEVEVDGQPANTIEAPRDAWSTLQMQFDRTRKAPVSRRIDLRVPSAACRLMVGRFKRYE